MCAHFEYMDGVGRAGRKEGRKDMGGSWRRDLIHEYSSHLFYSSAWLFHPIYKLEFLVWSHPPSHPHSDPVASTFNSNDKTKQEQKSGGESHVVRVRAAQSTLHIYLDTYLCICSPRSAWKWHKHTVLDRITGKLVMHSARQYPSQIFESGAYNNTQLAYVRITGWKRSSKPAINC